RPARRTHAPVWLGMTFADMVMGVGAAASFAGHYDVWFAMGLLYMAGLVALPFAFLAGLARVRWARHRVADLVVELERAADPARPDGGAAGLEGAPGRGGAAGAPQDRAQPARRGAAAPAAAVVAGRAGAHGGRRARRRGRAAARPARRRGARDPHGAARAGAG